MKRSDGKYIFKERFYKYIFMSVVIGGFIVAWFLSPSFPFGDKLSTLLGFYVIFCVFLLAVPWWGIIFHPFRLELTDKGFHYYGREFTLSDNSTLWHDTETFIPWDEIKSFFFFFLERRGFWSDIYLVLERREDGKLYMRDLSKIRVSKNTLIAVIAECSQGRCELDKEYLEKSVKERNKNLLQKNLMALVFVLVILFIRYLCGF